MLYNANTHSANTHIYTHSSRDEFMVKFNLIWHSKTYPYVCAQLRAKIILVEDDLRRVQECMQPPENVWGDTQHDQQKWRYYCLKATFIKSYIFFIIVISLSPFSSWTPRNSSSFRCNAGLKVGTVITGLHLLHLQHHPPEERKEQLNHPFRRLSCLRALIQVSELSVVLGFCRRLGSLISVVSRSIQSYIIILHSCPFFTACNLLD